MNGAKSIARKKALERAFYDKKLEYLD